MSQRHYQPEPQIEMHLPDESRVFPVQLWDTPCRCGMSTILIRRGAKEFRVACAVWVSAGCQPASNLALHTDPTPWLPSSDQAIRHWKLVAVLSKP